MSVGRSVPEALDHVTGPVLESGSVVVVVPHVVALNPGADSPSRRHSEASPSPWLCSNFNARAVEAKVIDMEGTPT
jgi:hypothetical protein